MLDGVLPSGQQPNSVLSQDDLSSAVGTVVLATVGPGEDTQALITIHEASEFHIFKTSYPRDPKERYAVKRLRLRRRKFPRSKPTTFVFSQLAVADARVFSVS